MQLFPQNKTDFWYTARQLKHIVVIAVKKKKQLSFKYYLVNHFQSGHFVCTWFMCWLVLSPKFWVELFLWEPYSTHGLFLECQVINQMLHLFIILSCIQKDASCSCVFT